MTINRSLLTNLPTNTSDNTVDNVDQRITQLQETNVSLQEQVDILSKQIEMLAGFEKNLIRAFSSEIDLLQEINQLSPNTTQKQIAKDTSSILNRILRRWCEQAEYSINREKMSIDKT